MNKLPSEIVRAIHAELDMSDQANYLIALGLVIFEHNHDSCGDVEIHAQLDVKGSIGKEIIIRKNPDLTCYGTCYLSFLKKPISAIRQYGLMIESRHILTCFSNYGLYKTPYNHQHSRRSTGNPFVGHLTDIYNNERKRKLEIQSSIAPEIVIDIDPRVIERINPEEWKLYGMNPIQFGALNPISIKNLVSAQSAVTGYYCPEPSFYQSAGKQGINPTVSLSGSTITIMYHSLISEFSIDSQDLGKIRHDFVASLLQENTDEELRSLGIDGPEGDLTPDYIDTNTKQVLELGTSKSNSIGGLSNDFEGKKIKYDYLLQPLQCNTYYLIVSSTCLYTNLVINQDTIDELCFRFRMGVQLEYEITEILGVNIFSGPNSEDMRIAKALFSNMTPPVVDKNDYEQFPVDIIMSMRETPSDDDFKHSSKIMDKCLKESYPKPPAERDVLENYLNKFKLAECQTHRKRVTNVPLILTSGTYFNPTIDIQRSDAPGYLKTLWSSASAVSIKKQSYEEEIKLAFGENKINTDHVFKKESLFTPSLTIEEQLELAHSGVGAKMFSSNLELLQKESLSKLSFHPTTDTTDINDFINSDTLNLGFMRTGSVIRNIVQQSKQISTRGSRQNSIPIWLQLLDYQLISFFDQVTEIFHLLSHNYKHWTRGGQFLLRETESGIKLLIKNTGSHIFVSFAFPKQAVTALMDTGRLGPNIFTSENYYFTDFSSFNEPSIEHFVKAGPYISSLLIHLISKYELEPTQVDSRITKIINFIALTYLNNKTDSEEMLTSQRYLFMKLFEDATQDPYIFTDRLPEVLRSRLSVFILNKLIYQMDYYRVNRILKIPKVSGNNVIYQYLNVKSIITMEDVTLSQKIDEFYYGYVVSKERGRGADRNFKIIKKILQEEYKFRDSVRSVFTNFIDQPAIYTTDPQLLRVFLHLFRGLMAEKIGGKYEDIILNDFLSSLSFTNFTQLATLKASAKDHSKPINVPENLDDDRKKLLKSLNTRNKEESSKRPKVLEALLNLVKTFKSETGKPVRHMMQLIPWCLEKLEIKGYFDSDIFPKPQHGGDREIHVLEIMARVVQYTVELMSRTICSYFISESITHPETKDNFVSKHYKLTSESFKESYVISKSADASKWCQRHHASHFAAMLAGILPPLLVNFTLRTLKLWIHKKISFPLQMVATLLANKNTYSTNKTFVRFRNEFYEGKGIFQVPMSNKMEIQSGMMQGILHYTSSLYHTMIQEVMKILVCSLARKRFSLDIVCSVIQGSDDSGMMLGIKGKISKLKMFQCYTLMRLKEEVAKHLSIYWNVCKSSIGTIDLLEYNSEWFSRHQIMKPTFRWISACMELSVTERFIDRVRIFNQVLTQCLEGGASTLECSIVQLNQAWLHYLMLGIGFHVLGDLAATLLMDVQDPSLGFFPLDYDLSCGLPGVDHQMFILAKYCRYSVTGVPDDTALQYDYEGSNRQLIPQDLRSVRLRFGKLYIWKSLVDRLHLGSIESAIEAVQKDPLILFGRHSSWDEEIPNLILKIFSPGVKESLNNVSPTLRMMASSSYILTTECITTYNGDELVKSSLLQALKNKSNSRRPYNSPNTIRQCFPLHHEYDSFSTMIHKLSETSETFEQTFSRSSKEKVIIFEVAKNSIDLIDMCKRKWNLGGKVPLSSRQFEQSWGSLVLQFPFLKPTIAKTAETLKMTYVELKNFLESLTLKTRKITLQDSPAAHGGLNSTISRIYWPNVKVRSNEESLNQDLLKLRSNLFSVMTYWYSDLTTEKMVSKHIISCKALRKPFNDIPHKYKKLKIMFDRLNGVDKLQLIENLKKIKLGTMGFFQQGQDIKRGVRTGSGTWVGQLMGIPVKIHLLDEFVTRIDIQHLSSSLLLGPMLAELVKEFKSQFSSNFFGSNLWLTTTGKLITRPEGKTFMIPVWIDKNLKIDIIKNLEINPWSIRVNNTTIRLVITEMNGLTPITYTILSDSISQREWFPEISGDLMDEDLQDWNCSRPAQLQFLEEELSKSIPETAGQFYKMMKTINKQFTRRQWSIQNFKTKIISLMMGWKEAKSSKMESQLEDSFSEANLEEVYKLLFDTSSYHLQQDILQTNFSWADEVIEEEMEVSSNWIITPEMESSLLHLTKDLEEVYSHPDAEEISDSQWMKMSFTNKFFQNIDKLSEIQTGFKFNELYIQVKNEQVTKVNGLLGKIISLCTNRFVYGVPDEIDTISSVDLLSETSRNVDTILSERDLENFSISSLRDSIAQFNSLSGTLTGLAAQELLKARDKYKRILNLKMSPAKVSELEDIDYPFIMNKIISFIQDHNISKFSHHTGIDRNLRLSLIKLEMLDSCENRFNEGFISLHELSIFRENINRNEVSTYLIDALKFCYDITVDIESFKFTQNLDDILIYI